MSECIINKWFAIEKDESHGLVLLAFQGSLGTIYEVWPLSEAAKELERYGTRHTLETAKSVTELTKQNLSSPEQQIYELKEKYFCRQRPAEAIRIGFFKNLFRRYFR